MLLVVLLVNALRPQPAPITRGDVAQAIASALASQTAPPPSAELIYAGIRPSIVQIDVTSRTGADGADQSGEGTGVVVTDAGRGPDGVPRRRRRDTITLTFADGSTSPARHRPGPGEGHRRRHRRTSRRRLPPAVLGNPGILAIGSDAYIVGNPFGLTGSMSAGVVSGLDRSFRRKDTGQVIRASSRWTPRSTPATPAARCSTRAAPSSAS